MKRSTYSKLAAPFVAGAIALAAPLAAPAADITLTYAFFAPAGTFPGRQMQHWADELTKRTNGKVAVKTFPGGTLLGAREMYDGVSKGVADIGLGAPSYDPGRFPLTSGVSLPLGFPNATVASRTLWELTKEFQPKEYENFKVLAMFTTEPGYIQSRNPAGNAEQLAGMKLRAAGTGVPVPGATPTIHRWPARRERFATPGSGSCAPAANGAAAWRGLREAPILLGRRTTRSSPWPTRWRADPLRAATDTDSPKMSAPPG